MDMKKAIESVKALQQQYVPDPFFKWSTIEAAASMRTSIAKKDPVRLVMKDAVKWENNTPTKVVVDGKTIQEQHMYVDIEVTFASKYETSVGKEPNKTTFNMNKGDKLVLTLDIKPTQNDLLAYFSEGNSEDWNGKEVNLKVETDGDMKKIVPVMNTKQTKATKAKESL